MTLEQTFIALAGTILSLLFSYAPGLSDWWETKDSVTKSLIMAVLVVVVGVGSLLWKCNFGAECLQVSWTEYATAIFFALVANQGTYSISPKKAAIKAKLAKKEVN